MMSPGMIYAPPPTTYPAPAYVPQRPTGAAQPKAVIRAQAPEEPKPARPPLLTLPSPEQLGVAVRPAENSADWRVLHARMKELGVLSFHMETLPGGQSRFTCWVPGSQPGLTRRIESVAATESEAVQSALQEAARTKR